MDVKLPDGTIIRNIPDGTSKADLVTKLKSNGYDTSKLETPSDGGLRMPGISRDLLNQNIDVAKKFGMGALSGAAGIGANLLYPVDKALNAAGISDTTNDQRKQALQDYFKENSDPNSLPFKTGELGAELAGTAGVGGGAGTALRMASKTPRALEMANALRMGGMAKDVPFLTNVAGGAGSAALGTLLIDPDNTGTAGVVGGTIPVVGKVAGPVAGYAADQLNAGGKRLMQSALKPTIEQLRTGKADTAVNTLLDEGLNATKGGVDKLRMRVGDLNNQIKDKIANSTATVDKQAVLNRLADTNSDFARQVSPSGDLNAIRNVADDFLDHPLASGNQIPVQLAQDLKQGTYSTLAKKYGQVGTADTEAQKALARGLKEEIANAVPDVAGLNAQESKLITTLGVTERRALMDANKNPMGLSLLAQNPTAWAAFMADKSALFKSLAARLASNAVAPAVRDSSATVSNILPKTVPVLTQALSN